MYLAPLVKHHRDRASRQRLLRCRGVHEHMIAVQGACGRQWDTLKGHRPPRYHLLLLLLLPTAGGRGRGSICHGGMMTLELSVRCRYCRWQLQYTRSQDLDEINESEASEGSSFPCLTCVPTRADTAARRAASNTAPSALRIYTSRLSAHAAFPSERHSCFKGTVPGSAPPGEPPDLAALHTPPVDEVPAEVPRSTWEERRRGGEFEMGLWKQAISVGNKCGQCEIRLWNTLSVGEVRELDPSS